MQFGKVIGNVVSTQKTGATEGIRLLVVEQLDENLNSKNKFYVCTDTVNSKPGDIALTCSSSSARRTSTIKGVCTDNSIFAVVEIISSKKIDLYNKMSQINFEDEVVKMFGKSITVNRKTIAFGDNGLTYSYSGQKKTAHPFPDYLIPIKEVLEKDLKQTFNFVLVNYYPFKFFALHVII